jgi:hypothetical protein
MYGEDNTNTDVYVNDLWSMYFHDPEDADWTYESYIKLSPDVTTINEFWQVVNPLQDRFSKGMFFFMRADCFPCWDDPSNIQGGCLSMKVLKEHVGEFMTTLCIRAAGETLLLPEYANQYHLVNGVSASPKKYFCVVKIWLRTDTLGSKTYFNLPSSYSGDVFFKRNIDVISEDQKKTT